DHHAVRDRPVGVLVDHPVGPLVGRLVVGRTPSVDSLMPRRVPACRERSDRLTHLEILGVHPGTSEGVEPVVGGGSDLESGVELDLQNRNLLGRLVWPTHPPDNRQLALWMPRVDLDILTL